MEHVAAVEPPAQPRNAWRSAHFVSGLLLAVFVGVHLTNHLTVLIRPAMHIAFMKAARLVYRNPIVESVLLTAVFLQIITGLCLVGSIWRVPKGGWGRLHIVSGLYLVFFCSFTSRRCCWAGTYFTSTRISISARRA